MNAAALLRQKDLGSLAAGKIADVVAVPGNPLDDISLMKRVSFVMKEGVVYKLNSVPVDTALYAGSLRASFKERPALISWCSCAAAARIAAGAPPPA